jgi:hypothetical protein
LLSNDRQPTFCTVVQRDTQRRIVVASSIENSVRPVLVLPKSARPKLRGQIIAAAGQFGRHPQTSEISTVKRHQPQIAAQFQGRNGTPGEIVERQNSYGRIAEKCLGEADFGSGSEITYAEPPVWIVETIERLVSGAWAEPKRMFTRCVNAHPTGACLRAAQWEAPRQSSVPRQARAYAACSPKEAATVMARSMSPDLSAFRIVFPPKAGVGAINAES